MSEHTPVVPLWLEDNPRPDVPKSTAQVMADKGARRIDRWMNERNQFGTRRDPMTRTFYAADHRLGRAQLDALFEHDWLSRRVVEIPAKDATREWITLHHDSNPAQAEKARTELERLNARGLFQEGIRLGRLYGGALMVLGAFDGGEVSTPLALERVREVQFVHLVDRWLAMPQTFYADPAENRFGEVETYLVQRIRSQGSLSAVVHESRVIRFDGDYLPPLSRIRNFTWDAPVLQNVYEALRQFGVAMQSGAAVLQDFVTKKARIGNLKDLIANDEWEVIYNRLAMMASEMAVHNLAFYGDEEEIEKMGTPTQGLPDLMGQFIDVVSAASDIPKSRLFGNQSGALGGDQGKNDLRIHYDNISAFQEAHLRSKLRRFLDVVLAPLGVQPGEIDFEFRPLWQLSETEDAEVRLKVAQSDTLYVQMGAVEPEEVALSRFGGDGINITDLNIDVARREQALKELSALPTREPPAAGGEEESFNETGQPYGGAGSGQEQQ